MNRIEKIKKQIQLEKKVSVAELMKLYGVTGETIRRDLEKLENEGVLTRTFGGAVLNMEVHEEDVHFYKRSSTNLAEKRIIGGLAGEILGKARTIAADASTTVMEAVRFQDRRDLTIISSSTEIFHQMGVSKTTIISTGGVFNDRTLGLEGKLAEETIRKYNVDIALLSCKGLDMSKGIMDTSEQTVDIKICMADQAEKVMLLADHTKFNRVAFVNFLDWERVDCIVTDRFPGEDWAEFLKQRQIALVCGKEERGGDPV